MLRTNLTRASLFFGPLTAQNRRGLHRNPHKRKRIARTAESKKVTMSSNEQDQKQEAPPSSSGNVMPDNVS
jgi:hypothetical protein